MILLTILLSITSIALCYGCYNLIKQNEALEEAVSDTEEYYQTYLQSIREKVLQTEIQLKELDIRGAFQADDEVGSAFSNMRDVHTELTNFIELAFDRNK